MQLDPTLILRAQDFLTLVLSIIIEAFPFVILGVSISTIIGVGLLSDTVKFIEKNKKPLFILYYPILFSKFLDSLLHRNRIYQHVKASFIGVFLPVCECGNVPLARRLLLNGFSVSQTVTFLLAAPILNPITFITTAEAFSFDPSVVYIRLIGAFVIANGIGILLSYKKNQFEFLTDEFYKEVCEIPTEPVVKDKLGKALDIFQHEFIEVMRVLCIGAILAGLSQVLIPRDIILSIGQNPVLSILAMILLAFVISICSNVDAFFALSYTNTFTIGSILSFLIFGPLIDIKMLTMLRSTFRPQLLVIISVLTFLASFLIGLIVNYMT